MNKNKLKELLNLLETDKNQDNSFIASEYKDNLHKAINILFQEAFNKPQYEWIDWWMWEADFGKKTELTKNSSQKTSKAEIAVDSFDNLWKVLKFLNKKEA